jgi:hypothetical protein
MQSKVNKDNNKELFGSLDESSFVINGQAFSNQEDDSILHY